MRRVDSLQLRMAQHSPTQLVRALRVAAETARRDPYWTPDDGEKRAQHYEAEADRIEGLS